MLIQSNSLPLFSAVIPTWRRTTQLRDTLNRLLACQPAPAEIFVHVDAGDPETISMLAQEYTNTVRWVTSEKTQGPGGGRNLLIAQAQFPLIACFDDDSWPIDKDFFLKAAALMTEYPRTAVLAGQVTLRGQEVLPPSNEIGEANCYENCACVLRKEAFLQTSMYLPLRYAYGMEEMDVALQLLDQGWSILRTPQLRVYHDSDLNHHASKEVNASHITNAALLAFLRYPVLFWPLGVAQVLNRARYAFIVGRHQGILQGLLAIPATVRRYRRARKPVQKATISRSRKLAQTGTTIGF